MEPTLWVIVVRALFCGAAVDTALVVESSEQLQGLVREFRKVRERRKLRVMVVTPRLWWWEGKGLHVR